MLKLTEPGCEIKKNFIQNANTKTKLFFQFIIGSTVQIY